MKFNIRILTVITACIFLNAQLCIGQYTASAVIEDDYYYYTDSTRKILPATGEELIVDVRILPDDILEKFKNDPDFNYEGSSVEAEDLITKIKNWINRQLIILSSSKTYVTLMDILYYGLMIAALLLIMRGLLKADRRGLLFGRIKDNNIRIVEFEEDIGKINFDDLIRSAMDKKQYKLAVRYFYLKSLQMLSGRGLVELKNNKTNYQYLNEIKNNRIAEAFRVTTNRFEWIWYGDFPVDENTIKYSQTDFNKLFALIGTQ
jgi:hypothetical protein